MSIILNRVKRFPYLILGCFLCCLPAFATLFTPDFFTSAYPLTGNMREADMKGSVRGTASLAGTPPEAIDVRNFYLQSIPAELFQLLPLIAKDSDGTITGFRIVTRPANTYGKLYVNSTAINSDNYAISLAEAKQLRFEPAANNINQNVTFTFTAIDNENLSDASPATFTIPITTNSANLVCSGTGLGSNILGAAGTFSAPYITPNPTVSCINNNSNVASPTGNLGNRKDAQTSYTYASTSGSLGPEGTYSFLKTLGTMSTRNCIKTDWVASDHTGDGGYAMIVNGSPNSTTFGKTFYQATSIPVCPNTLYEFSAYVINFLPGNHYAAQPGTEPNISFYINGQLVST
ncbi:MAG: hypothetical protein WBJ10_16135, partial [Daejeonella sp.]|uniref:hypothetical protein n=1 Tax=Daejeonella sp. TaxID=2805397 RepID=UPI003C70C163